MPQPVQNDASNADADFGNFETVSQQTPISNPVMNVMSPVQNAPMSAVPAAQSPMSALPAAQNPMSPFPQTPMNAFSQSMVIIYKINK